MYRWVDHTAEMQLEIAAPSEEAVFAEAARALGELLGAEEARAVGAPSARRTVQCQAADRATQLADWLGELVYLAEIDEFVPDRVTEIELTADEVTAAVAGRIASPPHLVKAVTYHDLAFEQAGGEWKARGVLDV
jgi:SHS2 domain-containing protein